jgi:hypothetical protein
VNLLNVLKQIGETVMQDSNENFKKEQLILLYKILELAKAYNVDAKGENRNFGEIAIQLFTKHGVVEIETTSKGYTFNIESASLIQQEEWKNDLLEYIKNILTGYPKTEVSTKKQEEVFRIIAEKNETAPQHIEGFMKNFFKDATEGGR